MESAFKEITKELAARSLAEQCGFEKNTLLQINTTVNYGSHGRIAEEIGLMAIAKGWKSYIAFGRHKCPSTSNLIRIGNKPDVLLHGLQTRIFDRHGLGSYKATKGLVKQISDIQPDIIHLHNLHGYFINYEVLFEYLSGINTPVVWTLHDCWPFTGHCAYFDFVDCHKWQTLCRQCPQKRNYPASLFKDSSMQNFEKKKKVFNSVKNIAIVPVSDWLADMVSRSFLGGHPMRIIKNGINTAIFSPKANNLIRAKYALGKQFIILGVANVWDKRKGFEDFLQLAGRLDEGYIVILVGLKKKQNRQLPRNIIGIEQTDNLEELAALYCATDVFVNPSYEESLGMTTIEAMACGTPSVVYNVTALPEVVTRETGFVVQKGDIDGLIQSVKFIKNKGKSSFIKACRHRAIHLFNKEDRFAEYFQLYDSLIKNNRRSL